MTSTSQATQAPQAPKPIRSPSYPNMALRDAVEEVGKIERLYRSASVDREVAAKLIGYSSLSGPANKALAALASFGLLERAGKGEARVTERARDILHAETPDLRRSRLLDAALEPELFREIRERFPGISVPPEDGVVTYLNRQGFNPNAVRPAAKAFLETMAYLEEIGANESHSVGSGITPKSDPSSDKTPTYGGAVIGDLIQWEADGVLKLKSPTRVRAVQSHEGKDWVFVDGSETGIPMEQVIVQAKEPGSVVGTAPPRLAEERKPLQQGMKEEKNALDEGEAILILPESLSVESVRDLEYWLDGILKKAKRRAGLRTPAFREKLGGVIKANLISAGANPDRITDEKIAAIMDQIE